MQNTIQGGAYQPVVAIIDVKQPPVASLPVPGAQPPSAARLQRSCIGPRHFMAAFFAAGIFGAVVLGIGTGTGDSRYLTAGLVSVAASVVGTAVCLRLSTETYTLAGSIGDNRAVMMTVVYFAALCWTVATVGSHLNAEVPIYRVSES